MCGACIWFSAVLLQDDDAGGDLQTHVRRTFLRCLTLISVFTVGLHLIYTDDSRNKSMHNLSNFIANPNNLC